MQNGRGADWGSQPREACPKVHGGVKKLASTRSSIHELALELGKRTESAVRERKGLDARNMEG